ncbi:SAVED domain-containing protein [Paenibacillus sp. PsM32]|uniref:SAVED domain-containing protein n=1 Tax=unclassified Paenibacillus TaxID=185978 RepID=UPI0023653876|nr:MULTISPECIES: SAVED domain-containing protein [unclassified Paenibacillus]MDN4617660.1 SAVED domain-containing protein [Paenibacillus sp. PsM32]WDF52884.1 SAVED domain-containing protein [Paenibacillus sp. KACC 21273]
MGKPIDAINAGLTYQNLYFWLFASELLHSDSNIKEVSYEDDRVKSIDDVVVEYIQPIKGDYSIEDEIIMDFYQVKYHVKNSNQIKLLDLIDPLFINASAYSFLNRVHDALKQGYTKARFHLVTPWNIQKGDPLEKLLDNQHNKLNLNALFDGRPSTKMARARKAMMKQLGLKNENELRNILSTVRIQHSKPGISFLIREQLNAKLMLAGLRPVDFTVLVNPYNDLIVNCASKGSKRFNKEDLLKLCRTEKLYTGQPMILKDNIPVGIRSFLPYTENLEEETHHLLCMSDDFDGRLLKSGKSWNEDIHAKVAEFTKSVFSPGSSYLIQFNTHLSITFAVGLILNPKSGVRAFPVQRGNGLIAWIPDLYDKTMPNYSKFIEECLDDPSSDSDTVVAISVTRNVKDQVEWYLEEKGLAQKLFYHFYLPLEGVTAIEDATHSWILAEQVIRTIGRRKPHQKKGKIHFFISAPGGFVFFLAQQATHIPEIVLYENHFSGDGSYFPSFYLPL